MTMIVAILSLTLLGSALGFCLGIAAHYLKVGDNTLVKELEELLPGSQCGQCGFPGCTAAAQALAEGQAPVTLCPPGGRMLVETLATKLGVEVNLANIAETVPLIAEVQEDLCIGCTRCFKVCPTDAVLGAAKQIHVIFREACTGCNQCVAICPTESIQLKPIPATLQSWYWSQPALTA